MSLGCAVDLFILAVENADTQQNDAREGNVLLYCLEVGTVEHYLVAVDKLGACCGVQM